LSAGDVPPQGFVRSNERGPFTTHNGPFYHRIAEVGAEQAFFAEARHCNGIGLIHGGMLSAFLDGLLAAAVALETRAVPVTVHLSVDFLGMGRAGDWVLGAARVTRATKGLAFVEGRASVKGRDLARATAVFKLMRRTGRTG
jgi:uncharacterized protein (TIGR00369 family)